MRQLPGGFRQERQVVGGSRGWGTTNVTSGTEIREFTDIWRMDRFVGAIFRNTTGSFDFGDVNQVGAAGFKRQNPGTGSCAPKGPPAYDAPSPTSELTGCDQLSLRDTRRRAGVTASLIFASLWNLAKRMKLLSFGAVTGVRRRRAATLLRSGQVSKAVKTCGVEGA